MSVSTEFLTGEFADLVAFGLGTMAKMQYASLTL